VIQDLEVLRVDRELREAIGRLELISHGPTMSFDPTSRDTSEEPGGRKPGRSDVDRPGRTASNDEKQAWFDSYHRKTPTYFNHRRQMVFNALGADAPEWESPDLFEVAQQHAAHGLETLRDECLDVLNAWRKRPLVNGQAPAKADPEWKRYIAESGRDSGDLAREYGVTRRYINRIKAMDWSAREVA
jgi:hypothetical protein